LNITEFTPGEQAVIEELKKGKSNAEIAESLGIGTGTVRTHLRSIFRQAGVGSRTMLLVKLMSDKKE
jgi:two-component system NarL family response regulator